MNQPSQNIQLAEIVCALRFIVEFANIPNESKIKQAVIELAIEALNKTPSKIVDLANETERDFQAKIYTKAITS